MKNLGPVFVFCFFAATCVAVAYFSGLNNTVFINAITILGALTLMSLTIQISTKIYTPNKSTLHIPKLRHIDMFVKLASMFIISTYPLVTLAKIISFFMKNGEYSRIDWFGNPPRFNGARP